MTQELPTWEKEFDEQFPFTVGMQYEPIDTFELKDFIRETLQKEKKSYAEKITKYIKECKEAQYDPATILENLENKYIIEDILEGI